MGNDVSKNMANRMAIGAMSNVTDLERPVIQRMSEKLADIAKREGSKDLVTKEEFAEALNGLEITQSDRDILDRIFVMLDRTGEDRINHKEFIVGIAPLINGDMVDKLNFSFELYDLDGTKQVKPEEMRFVLTAMNNTCSYFGDKTLTKEEIGRLTDEIFKDADVSQTGALSYSEYMSAVVQHPILVQFLAGGGD